LSDPVPFDNKVALAVATPPLPADWPSPDVRPALPPFPPVANDKDSILWVPPPDLFDSAKEVASPPSPAMPVPLERSPPTPPVALSEATA